MHIDIESSLGDAVHEMTPDEVTFTERDLLAKTLGTDAGEMILDLRKTMREGLTIDEEDLREALAEQDEGLPTVMDTLREGFSEGWTWTEQDLREVIADPDSPDAEEALATFDRARGAVGALRLLLALPLALALGLVAAAGFLGGRTWPARLGWAGGALAIAALFAIILTGPLYGSFAGNLLETARSEATIGDDETARLLTDKLWDTVTDASDDIIGVVRIRALLLLALGIAGVAGGIALARRKPRPPRRRARRRSPRRQSRQPQRRRRQPRPKRSAKRGRLSKRKSNPPRQRQPRPPTADPRKQPWPNPRRLRNRMPETMPPQSTRHRTRQRKRRSPLRKRRTSPRRPSPDATRLPGSRAATCCTPPPSPTVASVRRRAESCSGSH